MSSSRSRSERNSNTFHHSTLINAPVTAGSGASVNVSVGTPAADPEVSAAIADLRQAIRETQVSLDRREDEIRESLDTATIKLAYLEQELEVPGKKRDWSRVTKFMTGVRESLTGLTGLTASVDALWDAVEKVIH